LPEWKVEVTTETSGPRRVVVRAGNYQSARAGRPFAAQLTAVVVDRGGSPLRGVRVTFRVACGIATSQVLAAGPRTGTVRVLATASVQARPTSFSLRVLAPGPRRPEAGRHLEGGRR
jgi:hypothetical protein